MDAKQLKGRLRRKIIMHMLFQIGGAVVILGALFKSRFYLHVQLLPIKEFGLANFCFGFPSIFSRNCNIKIDFILYKLFT